MTGKEKLKLALNHEEGPLLFDIGGMPTTGMHCIVMEELRDYYGLEKHPIKILEPVQMLGVVEEDLKECLGVQTTPLWSAGCMFGFRVEDKWKEWRTPWGQDVLVPEEFEVTTNEKGDTLIYACGDRNSEPAGCMPKTGKFFDNIDRAPEYDEDTYDVRDNFEEFQPVGERDLAWLKKQKEAIGETGDVVMGNLGGTAFGDPALVPGPMLRAPKGIRRLTDWYMATVSDQDILHEIFSHEVEVGLKNLEKMYGVLGDFLDVTYICGTDFGSQRAPFYSVATFNDVYAPYYKKVDDWIHTHTKWATFKHTCGSIEPFIGGMADAGLDCINPVQWTANHMDRNLLKEKYGGRVVFWGGGIDTQHMLPEGTPEQVYEQALECCRIFGKGGGYVFNTIHNIVPGVSAANVDALARAVRTYNRG
ncbi:MAG TPA: methyltransferase [Lachnospiraceae bacterium]|nr:methyltransferase [Lachnospiraceae bacterium]